MPVGYWNRFVDIHAQVAGRSEQQADLAALIAAGSRAIWKLARGRVVGSFAEDRVEVSCRGERCRQGEWCVGVSGNTSARIGTF